VGSRDGGIKANQTLREKLGEEGYKEHMANIGARGGKAEVPKGFSFTRKRGPYAQELHTRGQIPAQSNEVTDTE